MGGLQAVFQALSDENRRLILKILKDGSRSAGDIGEALPIGRAALSHHLSLLKSAGLVRCEKRGQLRVYSLNTSAFEDFTAWVLDLTARENRKEEGSS
jgi:DNA-binding transcriptional ArsR family regulator